MADRESDILVTLLHWGSSQEAKDFETILDEKEKVEVDFVESQNKAEGYRLASDDLQGGVDQLNIEVDDLRIRADIEAQNAQRWYKAYKDLDVSFSSPSAQPKSGGPESEEDRMRRKFNVAMTDMAKNMREMADKLDALAYHISYGSYF